MRKQINEVNAELNNVQVRENILKNQVQNQVRRKINLGSDYHVMDMFTNIC